MERKSLETTEKLNNGGKRMQFQFQLPQIAEDEQKDVQFGGGKEY